MILKPHKLLYDRPAPKSADDPDMSFLHFWSLVVAGLFGGTFTVLECCEHTETFFAKGHSSDEDAFACLLVALPFAVALGVILRFFGAHEFILPSQWQLVLPHR